MPLTKPFLKSKKSTTSDATVTECLDATQVFYTFTRSFYLNIKVPYTRICFSFVH